MYKPAIVAEALHVNTNCIRDYARRDGLRLDADEADDGKWSLYSFPDVARVRLMARLIRDFGAKPKNSAAALNSISENFADLVTLGIADARANAEHRPGRGAVLIFDGVQARIFASADEFAAYVRSGEQTFTSAVFVDVLSLVRDVDAALARAFEAQHA
jgi:hypothetical protein